MSNSVDQAFEADISYSGHAGGGRDPAWRTPGLPHEHSLGNWQSVRVKYSGFSICEAAPGRPHAETLNHLLHEVEFADRAGMDGWFFAEHHSNAGYSLTPSPNLLIAAAAARTERIRLGTMVTVLPYHHPFRAAEEIRHLDALSGGRLEVGLARGGIPHEQAAHGLESADNEEMLEVGTELLLRLLTEESVNYDTKYWKGETATVVPEQTQRPHPPMWLAAMSERTMDLAARFRMSCMTGLAYPEVLREQMQRYRKACEFYHPQTAPGRHLAASDYWPMPSWPVRRMRQNGWRSGGPGEGQCFPTGLRQSAPRHRGPPFDEKP